MIITYYWPPAGGAGVQRWLKFAKYLPEFGWDPVIYTPENPEYPSIDESLLADVPANCEVIRRPITEPYDLYRKFVGVKPDQKIQTGFLSETEKPKRGEAFARWVRGNFFIPDARMFWIKPSIAFLSTYLKENPVDLIVSTGPPHSMHLIAQKLKARTGLPWVADFRDPWTNIDFYEELKLTRLADRKHRRLERSVLEHCDQVIVVGDTMKEEFCATIEAKKITVIRNGFDTDDLKSEPTKVDELFTIAHIGSFTATRNSRALWSAIANLCKDKAIAEKLRIKVIGKVDITVKKDIEEAGILHLLDQYPYMSHDEVVQEQSRSNLLLLVINRTKNARGILTGKVFEYLASGRPILAIGPPDGDLAKLFQITHAGAVIDYEDIDTLQERIKAELDTYPREVRYENLDRFSRKALTKELTEVFQSLIQHG